MALKVAVFLSGNGSTLENIFNEIDAKRLDAEIVCVLSSREDAYGLERARQRDIPALTVPRKQFSDADSFGAAVWEAVDPYEPSLVVLAGFMCLITVPERYRNRMMNVHPALIPAFCGKGMYGERVHRSVLEMGAKVTGVTVHFVDAEYDNGPIIVQRAVEVLEDDTPESLAQRVQAREREIYPQAIQLFAQGRLEVEDRQVHVRPQ